MADSDVEKIAAEVATALRPVLQDVLMGKTEREVLDRAVEAALKLVGNHLAAANALVILADLRALLGVPAAVIRWLEEHPYARTDPDPEYWRPG